MTGPAVVRRIAEADWDAVAELEAAAYGRLGLSEGRAALRSRADASPGTCWLAADADGRPVGYLLALPYPEFRCPDLARPEPAGHAGDGRRNLHLHDLVIAERHRGRGLARRLLDRLIRAARSGGWERLSLVAVAGSAGYWAARGFTARPQVRPPAGYGTDAVYMSRVVPAGGPPPRSSPSPK